jgi:hypothetical protein
MTTHPRPELNRENPTPPHKTHQEAKKPSQVNVNFPMFFLTSKIVPQCGAEKKKNNITTKTTNHSDNNNDQVTPLQNIKVMPQEADA